jgi:hypothetical protein
MQNLENIINYVFSIFIWNSLVLLDSINTDRIWKKKGSLVNGYFDSTLDKETSIKFKNKKLT